MTPASSRLGHISRITLSILMGVLTGTPLPAALGPRYGGEATVALSATPASLDPAEPTSAPHVLALGLVHDRLVDLGPSGSLRPRLAASWQPVSDGREWTLSLAPARCHDDRPANADAVLASLRRFLRSPAAAAAAWARAVDGGLAYREGATDDVPGLSSADERSVTIRFAPGQPPLLTPLASWAAAITSVTGAPCGPFRAPVASGQGPALAFVSSHGHWAGRPFLDRVILTSEATPEGSRAAPPTPPETGDRAHIELGTGPPMGPPERFALWVEREDLREALAACDWRPLARRFLPDGIPLPTLLGISAGTSRLRSPSSTVPSVTGKREMTLVVGRDVIPQASQRVVAQMMALGLRPHVTVVSPEMLWEGKGDARLGLWLPDVSVPGLIVRQAARLARVDIVATMCDKAERMADPTQRLEAAREADAELLATGAVVPLGAAPLHVQVGERLQGVRVDRGGRLVLEDAWLAP